MAPQDPNAMMAQGAIEGVGGNSVMPPQATAPPQEAPVQEQAPLPSKFEIQPNELELLR
jgi:hypothetical protein